MGVVNVTSLHSWSIDVTSLIEGILLTNAQYFSYRHPLLLWSTLQKFSTVQLCLWKRGLFRESWVQALILFRHFPLPMRITICDDDMISIAPAFRSMKSLDMGDAWTTHGVKIVPPHHVHRTFYLLVCTPVSQSVCVVEFNDHVRTPLRLRHVFLYPTFSSSSWSILLLNCCDILFETVRLVDLPLNICNIPKLRVVSLDSLTIISFSVAYAESISEFGCQNDCFDTIFE
jgi:hypothetical protein